MGDDDADPGEDAAAADAELAANDGDRFDRLPATSADRTVEGRVSRAAVLEYFADRFGLKQAAVEKEGKTPTLGNIQAIAQSIAREGVRALFVQPQFSTDTAEAIARTAGIDVVRLDPLARDYPANLKRMAKQVRAALSAGEQ